MYVISNITVKNTGTHQHKQTKFACLLVMRADLIILLDHLSLAQSRWSGAGHQWPLAWTAAKKKTRRKGEMMEGDRPSSAPLGGSPDDKSLLSPTENCWGMTPLTQRHRVSALKRQRPAGPKRLNQVVWILDQHLKLYIHWTALCLSLSWDMLAWSCKTCLSETNQHLNYFPELATSVTAPEEATKQKRQGLYRAFWAQRRNDKVW